MSDPFSSRSFLRVVNFLSERLGEGGLQTPTGRELLRRTSPQLAGASDAQIDDAVSKAASYTTGGEGEVGWQGAGERQVGSGADMEAVRAMRRDDKRAAAYEASGVRPRRFISLTSEEAKSTAEPLQDAPVPPVRTPQEEGEDEMYVAVTDARMATDDAKKRMAAAKPATMSSSLLEAFRKRMGR